MAANNILPDKAEFSSLASRHRLVPVWAEKSNPALSPLDAYERLNGHLPSQGSFLLDGEPAGPDSGRYAYVGYGTPEIIRLGPAEPAGSTNPAAVLRTRLTEMDIPRIPDLPPFTSGVAGYVAYEAIRYFETRVAHIQQDPNGCPEAAFIIPHDLIVFDRNRSSVYIVAIANVASLGSDSAYYNAHERISHAIDKLFYRPVQPRPVRAEVTKNVSAKVAYNKMSRKAYISMVHTARRAIIDGELIQAVLSQRIVRPTNTTPLALYRALANLNPSPYMYLFDFGDFSLIGASPERHLRVKGRTVEIHPIAGTRPRGASAAEDSELESSLLSSEKEQAEHLMLLDLARNDVGSVCRPGTVKVLDLMSIERYSHVMHIVSRVAGELEPNADAIDAFVASFPAGTLTGAPKIRAIQLIQDLEPEGRGPYCGAAGWFSCAGEIDTGTVIRSILLKDGLAHIQGGGGIVYDSLPDAEYNESIDKAQAALRSIELAEQVKTNAILKIAHEAALT